MAELHGSTTPNRVANEPRTAAHPHRERSRVPLSRQRHTFRRVRRPGPAIGSAGQHENARRNRLPRRPRAICRRTATLTGILIRVGAACIIIVMLGAIFLMARTVLTSAPADSNTRSRNCLSPQRCSSPAPAHTRSPECCRRLCARCSRPMTQPPRPNAQLSSGRGTAAIALAVLALMLLLAHYRQTHSASPIAPSPSTPSPPASHS